MGIPEWDTILDAKLVWYPELEIGYYPVDDTTMPYDKAYFDRFRKQGESEIGILLNEARVDFVMKYLNSAICDIGIGSGTFIEWIIKKEKQVGTKEKIIYGFDINSHGVEWLVNHERFFDPYNYDIGAMSFWDSLEHIKDFSKLLRNVKQYAFISIPIFQDCGHVLKSKHYRKDEHCWYFTHKGLITVMRMFGFQLKDHNNIESEIGREDIGTYLFERK